MSGLWIEIIDHWIEITDLIFISYTCNLLYFYFYFDSCFFGPPNLEIHHKSSYVQYLRDSVSLVQLIAPGSNGQDSSWTRYGEYLHISVIFALLWWMQLFCIDTLLSCSVTERAKRSCRFIKGEIKTWGLGQTRPTILKHPPIVLTYGMAECDWL